MASVQQLLSRLRGGRREAGRWEEGGWEVGGGRWKKETGRHNQNKARGGRRDEYEVDVVAVLTLQKVKERPTAKQGLKLLI